MPHEPPKKETKPRGFPPSFSALGARTPDEERARADGAKAEAERLSRALALAERHNTELRGERASIRHEALLAETRALGAQAELEAVLLRAQTVLGTELRGWVPGPDRDRMWNYVKGARADPEDGLLVEAILDAAPGAPSERLSKVFGCSYCDDERCKFGQEVCERAKTEYAEARRRGMPVSGRKA